MTRLEPLQIEFSCFWVAVLIRIDRCLKHETETESSFRSGLRAKLAIGFLHVCRPTTLFRGAQTGAPEREGFSRTNVYFSFLFVLDVQMRIARSYSTSVALHIKLVQFIDKHIHSIHSPLTLKFAFLASNAPERSESDRENDKWIDSSARPAALESAKNSSKSIERDFRIS